MYDLADRATELKAVLDGAMMLWVGSMLHSYEPFALGQIVDLGDQTKRDGPGLGNELVEPFDTPLTNFAPHQKHIKQQRQDRKSSVEGKQLHVRGETLCGR